MKLEEEEREQIRTCFTQWVNVGSKGLCQLPQVHYNGCGECTGNVVVVVVACKLLPGTPDR